MDTRTMRVRQQGDKGLITLTNAGSNPAPAIKGKQEGPGLDRQDNRSRFAAREAKPASKGLIKAGPPVDHHQNKDNQHGSK